MRLWRRRCRSEKALKGILRQGSAAVADDVLLTCLAPFFDLGKLASVVVVLSVMPCDRVSLPFRMEV
jgi:hypothetical protein